MLFNLYLSNFIYCVHILVRLKISNREDNDINDNTIIYYWKIITVVDKKYQQKAHFYLNTIN